MQIERFPVDPIDPVKHARLKRGQRGSRRALTNLRDRTTELIDHLEAHVVPTLKTVRKKQCEEKIAHVRKLL